MERREHNKRELKRRRLENEKSDSIYEQYVSNVTTPAGKFFYDSSVLGVGTYEITGKGKDDDEVDGRERTVTTTEDMEDHE